ncbi:DgyrCDS620 [Dimorphilus gyrociliatus]|uniref:DgyrCDS620 n=1 Tax=Dimorphilus gyrociliatus TaxID=2664684 RepID=A0A7I8V9Q1_9ANNE|nr:DgyrCDS620 [Dimorphilus gyrociliatus]
MAEEKKRINNGRSEENITATDATPFFLTLAAAKWKKETKLSLEKHETIGENLEKSLFDSLNLVYFEREEKLHEINSRDGQRKLFISDNNWYTNEKDNIINTYKLISEYRTPRNLAEPEACVTVSRSYDPIEQTLQKSVIQFLKYIFNENTWILTYGRDTPGYISEVFGKLYKDNNKIFLLGITEDIEIEEKWKAISGRQYNLQPQHTTYINFPNEKQSDRFRRLLEEEIVRNIREKDSNQTENDSIKDDNEINIRTQVYKYVYLLIGGDETTYSQLKNWYTVSCKVRSSRNVVMIVKDSGDIANLLIEALRIVDKVRSYEDYQRILRKYEFLYEFDSEEAFEMLMDIKKRQSFLEISEEKCFESNEIISKINALQECLDVDLSPNNLLYGIMDQPDNTSDIFTVLKVIYDHLYKLICCEHLWKLYQKIFTIDSTGTAKLLCYLCEEKSSLHISTSETSLSSVSENSKSTPHLDRINRQRASYVTTELIGDDCYIHYDPTTPAKFSREDKISLIKDIWESRNFEHARYTMKNERYVWDLLIYSILSNNKILTNELLEHTNSIAACLFALVIFKRLSDRAELISEVGLQNELKESSEYFEKLASEILKDLYNKDRKTAYGILQSYVPIDKAKNVQVLDIAVNTEAKSFLSGSCVQTYTDLVWRAGMINNWKYRLFILPGFILFSPLALLFGLISFSNLQKLEDDDDDSENKDSTFKQIKNSNFIAFFRSPVVKYSFKLTIYLFFLGLFSYFILTKLTPYKTKDADDMTIYELLIIIWVIGLFFDECRQIFLIWLEYRPFASQERKGCLKTIFNVFSKYFRGGWEVLDFTKILLFFCSVALRWRVEEDNFVVARIFFGITLILFYLRLLKFAYVFEALGPRILIIFMMTRDLIQFLFIAFIFLFSFGISYQAILGQWVDTDVSFYNVSTAIIAPQFWRIFGELQLKTIDKDKQSSDVFRWFLPAYVGIYLIAMNILLLNLLIAIFTNSFEQVRSESKQVWGAQKVSSTREYNLTPLFPSPINIITIILEIIFKILIKCLICCFGDGQPERGASLRREFLSKRARLQMSLKDAVISAQPKSLENDEKNVLEFLSDLSVDVAQMKKSFTASSVKNDNIHDLRSEIEEIKKLMRDLKRTSKINNNNSRENLVSTVVMDTGLRRRNTGEIQETAIKKELAPKTSAAQKYSDSPISNVSQTFYRKLSDVNVKVEGEKKEKDDGATIEIESQWL